MKPERPDYDKISTPEELAIENWYRLKEVESGKRWVYAPAFPLYMSQLTSGGIKECCSFGGETLSRDEWDIRYKKQWDIMES